MIDKVLKYSLVEHFLFFVLGFLAAYYVEERIIADSGYYLFRVIDNESFWVEHNRFILIFPEIMPLIAVKLGLSLNIILYFYSVGIVFIFYAVFIVARYYYNSKSAGVLILLLQTIGITSGFFVPMFELYFGAVLLVLFSAVLYSEKRNIIVLLLLSFFILIAHQYALFLYLFVLVFHAIEFRKKELRLYAYFILMIIIVYIFKSYAITEYEQAKTNAFLNNLWNQVYGLEYIKSLIGFLLSHYLMVILMLFTAIGAFILSKSYLKAVLTLLGFVGVLTIANISYYGFTFSRYQEQVYFSLSFLAVYPLVMFIYKRQNNLYSALFTFLTLIIVGIGINQIRIQGNEFTLRLNEMKTMIAKSRKKEGNKFFVKANNLAYYANWSYPIETILLSSRNSSDSTVTICLDEDIAFEENEFKLTSEKYLFRRWEIYDITSLNERYFRLKSTDYILLKKGNSR